MTIEILTIPLDKLEAMTDKELFEHFSPMFNVTRPQLKPQAPKPKVASPNYKTKHKAMDALDMLEKLGLNI